MRIGLVLAAIVSVIRSRLFSEGSRSVRFEACAQANPGAAAWNRGTQFPGYFLVNRRGCVRVAVEANGVVVRRTLRFGVKSCG